MFPVRQLFEGSFPLPVLVRLASFRVADDAFIFGTKVLCSFGPLPLGPLPSSSELSLAGAGVLRSSQVASPSEGETSLESDECGIIDLSHGNLRESEWDVALVEEVVGFGSVAHLDADLPTPRVIPLCTPLPVRLFLGSDLPPLLPLLSSSHGVADCEIIPVVDGAPFSTVPFVPPRLSCDTHSAHSLKCSFLYGGKDESFVPEFLFGKAFTYCPIIPDEVEVCYVQPEISFPFPTPPR